MFITDFPIIGPFEKYCPDYELKGTVRPTKSFNFVRERLSVGVMNGEMTYFSTKASHSVNINGAYPLTFTLPFSTMLGSKGLTCQISFVDQDNNNIESFSFNIKPKNSQMVRPGDYRFSYYSIPDTIVDPDNYDAIVSESFCFNGFIDYFNIDTYYRLSIENLYLTYKGIKDVPSTTSILRYYDFDNLFPGLSTGGSMTIVEIPLKTVAINNEIHFRIDSTLYVNPKTLDMSLEAKPGYVLTNYFYLPINRKSDFMSQRFTLVTPSFGYNETYFAWDIRYLTDRGLIGDCDHSDYCVRGSL